MSTFSANFRFCVIYTLKQKATIHLEVVKDVADEGHKANPFLSGSLPRLFSGFEFLLQSVQKGTPKHVPVGLFGLGLNQASQLIITQS